jgi:hypothetical protein
VITIRWQETAGNTDPVTGTTFNLITTNSNIFEDPGSLTPVKDGSYYYKTFAGIPSGPITLLNGVTVPMFSIDFSTAASAIDFELITGNTYTSSNNADVAINGLLGNQFNAFSPSVATFNGSSFPVEWLMFDAKPLNSRDVQLNWATGTETNNDFFQVEKSVDGELFQGIAKVSGAGTTSAVTEYEYLDKDFVATRVFYRLKQVDYNGQFYYSERVEVNFDPTLPSKVEFDLFPNPTVDFVTIQPKERIDGVYRMVVVDMSGRTVWNGSFDGNTGRVTLQVDKYTQGVYMVYLVGGQLVGSHLAGKFVKE